MEKVCSIPPMPADLTHRLTELLPFLDTAGDASREQLIRLCAAVAAAIRAEAAALAASPEVKALIREAEARGMERAAGVVMTEGAYRDTHFHRSREDLAAAIRAEAAAIRGEGK